VDVVGDGNCMFRAIAMALGCLGDPIVRDQDMHELVRFDIIREVESNFEHRYEESVDRDDVKAMKGKGVWGDWWCLKAAAIVYKRTVHVLAYKPGQGHAIPKGTTLTFANMNVATFSPVGTADQSESFDRIDPNNEIVLLCIDDTHYNVVVPSPLQASASAAAAALPPSSRTTVKNQKVAEDETVATVDAKNGAEDTSTLLIPRHVRGRNNPKRGSNETKPGFGKSGIGESIDVDEREKSMSLDDGDAKNNENNNTTNSAEKKISVAMETNGDEDEEEIEEDAEEREEREVEELEDMDDLEDKEIATARILQAAKEKKTKYEKLDLLKVKVEFACTSGSLSWRTYVLDMTSWMRGTNERAGFVLEKFQEVLRTEQKTELEKLEGNKEKMAFIVEALENNKEEVLDAMRKEKNAVRVLGERKQKFLTKNAELLGGLSYQECLTISETISLSKENHEMSGFEFGSDKNGDISSVLMDCGDFSVLTDEGEDEKTASFLVRTNEIVQRENEEERAKICALEETFRFYSLQGEHVGLSTLRALKNKEWTILKIRPKAFEHIEFIGPRDCKNFSTEKIFADKAIRGEYLSDEAYMRSVRGFYVCIDRRRQHVKWIIINISACRLIYLEAWLYYDYIVYLATENIIRTLRGQLTFAFDHNGLLDRLRERTTGKALVRKEMRPYGPFPKFKRTN